MTQETSSVKGRSSGSAPSRPGPKPDPTKPKSNYNDDGSRKETARKNVRMVLGGRCRNGHDLIEENVYYEGKYVRCRVCLSNQRRRTRGAPEVIKVPRRGTGFCGRGHSMEGHPTCRTCRRNRDIEKKYGLTVETFDALLQEQGGACAICSTSFETIDKRHLHVDHDHNIGVLRGLLCHSCNTALGAFSDDVSLLQRAIKYLTAFQRS